MARVVVCDFGFAKKKAIAVGARFGACDLGVLRLAALRKTVGVGFIYVLVGDISINRSRKNSKQSGHTARPLIRRGTRTLFV